jgi:hypothetical protein
VTRAPREGEGAGKQGKMCALRAWVTLPVLLVIAAPAMPPVLLLIAARQASPSLRSVQLERWHVAGAGAPHGLARSGLLRLRGGKIGLASGNEDNYVEVETASMLDRIRNSLDPAEYPPMEVQYNEHGDMIMPPPISLEPIAEFRRLVDENGRLYTSKEAEKLGLSNFTKRKKGKNSLAQRCICGNKLPCDGDVMITRNEHGKLEYHKIPRHWVGPAHNYETRQPAQYMVTPSDVNLTKLFGHLSPLLLHEVADMSGLSREEVMSYADPQARNATLHPRESGLPCVYCNNTAHLYIDCPWTTHLTPREVRQQQVQLQDLKARAQSLKSSGGSADELQDIERQIEDIAILLWAQEDYPEIGICVGNVTYRYNEEGTNEAKGQVTLRDMEKVTDKLPPPPPGCTVLVPGDFADMEKATRGARDGQTILVGAGESVPPEGSCGGDSVSGRGGAGP